jgi:hypothetical protein
MERSEQVIRERDLFAEARERFTITDLWSVFGFEGTPRPSCRSPFREDRSASFSIFDSGRAWHDHATGEGGDVIEFIRVALNTDHRGVREWLVQHLGGNTAPACRVKVPRMDDKRSDEPRSIQWPSEIREGTAADLQALCEARGISYAAAWTLTEAGVVRFTEIDNHPCVVIGDRKKRAAEIRRMDGTLFPPYERKAFPLKGVDKSWLVGAELLRREDTETAVMITEGVTDLLTAADLYLRYHMTGGSRAWVPVALLGATCRNLDPSCAALIRGRHVRLVPDGDDAGEQMAKHWTKLLRSIECKVDIVEMPQGTDLSDHRETLNPEDLFS